ncbi:E3 ubiquitin-protein ligase UPL4 isoform X2 [Amaranthus tricolor]|nr:E3 ubiquitin-protein ligase UPL4 isoform X2 [Amaranthus tricolor]
MESRGQKRSDIAEELPSDKRACSSLEIRPNVSYVNPETLADSVSKEVTTRDGDMETSSSSDSDSDHSDDEAERDFQYGSDVDDHRLRTLQRLQRSHSYIDSAKLKRIIPNLNNDADPCGQLMALTELCELISFCTEGSLSSMIAEQLASPLVKLAKHENNPDIMLLATRAITYLCDVFHWSSRLLVRHDAVPVLCQRLTVIEYLDVAELCLQALEKISHNQPLACLQSGAIMAVLNYIDFFSTSVQRTAIRIIVNLCKELRCDSSSPFMEAVPILCNLLQHEDRQLVELVATCLIKVGDCVKDSSALLSELYGHGVVNHVTRLIDVNSRISLSQSTYTGLVGLVSKIASGSADVVSTLFELDIGRILKDVLSNSDVSQGTPSPRALHNNNAQVQEILKLLHELLPEVTSNQNEELMSSIEKSLHDQSFRLLKFGLDALPTLVQVVSSGANLYVCYGCLSIIRRIVYFSKPEDLLKLFEGINIASFLAGIFTRNDNHVRLIALQITEMILEKLSNIVMPAFVKEGVLFAIDNLLIPDNSLQTTFPLLNSTQNNKAAESKVMRCLCYTYCTRDPKPMLDSDLCKANKDSIHSLAEEIKMKYFSVESNGSESMVTDLLQDLRNDSLIINDLVKISPALETDAQSEERLRSVLEKVILQLGGDAPISTFELIESGIIKALLNYLSNGQFLSSSNIPNDPSHVYVVQKRFEAFARISLSSHDSGSQDLPLSSLVKKLQIALSTVESFPIMAGYSTRNRVSYAAIPNDCPILYPCVRVRFVRGENDVCLFDYSKDAISVDPFCLVEEIEQFLRPKVKKTKVELSDNIPDVSSDMQSSLEEETYSSKATENLIEASSTCLHSNNENSLKGQTSNNNEDTPLKLVLYLDGEKLEYSSTLYQEFLHRQMKSPSERLNGSNLWSAIYTVTYRRVAQNETSTSIECRNICENAAKDNVLKHLIVSPLFSSIFSLGLGSILDSAGPSSDILLLLRSLEMINRFSYHLVCYERINAFGQGRFDNLNELKVALPALSQNEFVSCRLTEKLEQHMRDPSAVHIGAMPLWCSQLIARCPFLFNFESRFKFFQLGAFGIMHIPPNMSSNNDSNRSRDGKASTGIPPRKKFLVCRERILESATKMMDLYAGKKVVVEVEYSEEVGTGLGPTLEFYTLLSSEFQKAGSGMWRGDSTLGTNSCSQQGSMSKFMVSTYGLFPRPWSPTLNNINGLEFSDVIKKFVLLGQVVGKALQDGRVLDIPFSIAFYKLVLGKELSVCDIQSFDPELGKTLLEFKALACRQRCMEFTCGRNIKDDEGLMFQSTTIEDLCLNFTLPGYPDYVLSSGMDDVMVTINNLEEYISLVLDATLQSGVSRQVEAFRSGLNQVILDKHLQLFTEEELELLLCGERDFSFSGDLLNHVKYDHGYTATSPPIINFLEVINEFSYEQRRAFLQFVTGAPRLPSGGLAALNPKLTIVLKHSNNCPDTDLPSVMTCANYLKLPPYSSKEILKEKLLYAIIEGQESFHLS